jgi:hypothetical protein
LVKVSTGSAETIHHLMDILPIDNGSPLKRLPGEENQGQG